MKDFLLDRRWLGGFFGVAALIICAIGLFGPWNGAEPRDYGGLLLNLGSELIGIFLTVFLIDELNERRERRLEAMRNRQTEQRASEEEIKRLALDLLRDIDFAAWAWLGGRRRFHAGELLGLLRNATDADPLPFFIRNEIRDIGIQAAEWLEQKHELIASSRPFGEALEILRPLAGIQDTPRLPAESNDLANVLSRAVRRLSIAANIEPGEDDGDAEWRKDTNFRSQQSRYYGRIILDREYDRLQD